MRFASTIFASLCAGAARFRRVSAVGTRAAALSVAALAATTMGLPVAAEPPNTPAILGHANETDRKLNQEYLPDFSFAGFQFGEQPLGLHHQVSPTIFDVTEFGARGDDALDDSAGISKAVAAAHAQKGPVVVQFPPGRFILSDIIYIERSDFVMRGAGSGATQLYFPRPLMYSPDPPALQELREYLVKMNKRQREKHNNLDLPFSQYAWSGGFIWTRVPGERVKAYLDEYHQPQKAITRAVQGTRGSRQLQVKDTSELKAGDVVRINWYNKAGENGPLVNAIYQGAEVTVGSHHWTLPEQPLVSQQVVISAINGKTITIKDTLLHDIGAEGAEVASWPHLSNVGIEHLSLQFPDAPRIAHHVEQGFNGIYLTRLFNGWVRDINIHNADSGILTEEVANVTIADVTTTGTNIAHYSVAMGDTHNVLVKNLQVFNTVVHPLSFNTFSTRSVYTHSEVFTAPVLDQHSGANHQNLFDDIRVHVSLDDAQRKQRRFPLFKGGGASYWKPTHGAFSTFWNISVQLDNGFDSQVPITLYGVNDGPEARLVGVHGNAPLAIEYGPDAYVEGVNHFYSSVPSLYEYQLRARLSSQ